MLLLKAKDQFVEQHLCICWIFLVLYVTPAVWSALFHHRRV